MAIEVDILDAQADALHQPHPGAVKQLRQQGIEPVHMRQDASDLVLGQYGRNAAVMGRPLQVVQPGQLDGQHLAVQKQERTERLVVRGRRNLALGGQHGQEGFYLRRTHVARVPQATPADEKPGPVQIELFGAEAIVQIPRALTNLV